jgi:hypothetical protein
MDLKNLTTLFKSTLTWTKKMFLFLISLLSYLSLQYSRLK